MSFERADYNRIPDILIKLNGDIENQKAVIKRLTPDELQYFAENYEPLAKIAKECDSATLDLLLGRFPVPISTNYLFRLACACPTKNEYLIKQIIAKDPLYFTKPGVLISPNFSEKISTLHNAARLFTTSTIDLILTHLNSLQNTSEAKREDKEEKKETPASAILDNIAALTNGSGITLLLMIACRHTQVLPKFLSLCSDKIINEATLKEYKGYTPLSFPDRHNASVNYCALLDRLSDTTLHEAIKKETLDSSSNHLVFAADHQHSTGFCALLSRISPAQVKENVLRKNQQSKTAFLGAAQYQDSKGFMALMEKMDNATLITASKEPYVFQTVALKQSPEAFMAFIERLDDDTLNDLLKTFGFAEIVQGQTLAVLLYLFERMSLFHFESIYTNLSNALTHQKKHLTNDEIHSLLAMSFKKRDFILHPGYLKENLDQFNHYLKLNKTISYPEKWIQLLEQAIHEIHSDDNKIHDQLLALKHLVYITLFQSEVKSNALEKAYETAMQITNPKHLSTPMNEFIGVQLTAMNPPDEKTGTPEEHALYQTAKNRGIVHLKEAKHSELALNSLAMLTLTEEEFFRIKNRKSYSPHFLFLRCEQQHWIDTFFQGLDIFKIQRIEAIQKKEGVLLDKLFIATASRYQQLIHLAKDPLQKLLVVYALFTAEGLLPLKNTVSIHINQQLNPWNESHLAGIENQIIRLKNLLLASDAKNIEKTAKQMTVLVNNNEHLPTSFATLFAPNDQKESKPHFPPFPAIR